MKKKIFIVFIIIFTIFLIGAFNNNSYAYTDLSSGEVTIEEIPDQTYTGRPIKPKIRVKHGGSYLTENRDYAIRGYFQNINTGVGMVEIQGIGNDYRGTLSESFRINPKDISSCSITINPYDSTYTGSPIEPDITVMDGGQIIDSGSQTYTISYSDNINVGTATVTIRGMGNYTGFNSATYSITAKPIDDNENPPDEKPTTPDENPENPSDEENPTTPDENPSDGENSSIIDNNSNTSSEDFQNITTNTSSNNKSNNSISNNIKDNTVSKTILPKAGFKHGIIAISILVLVISIIFYKRYTYFKDIK